MMETEKFTVRLTGLSRDLRTNSWELTCKKCKNVFKPATTMLAWQTITCGKCGTTETINYNEYDNNKSNS